MITFCCPIFCGGLRLSMDYVTFHVLKNTVMSQRNICTERGDWMRTLIIHKPKINKWLKYCRICWLK